MSGTSAIEWTQATWNPVVGCTHVSAGCDYCYAARNASGRLSANPVYAGLATGGRFTGEIRLLHDRLHWPLHRRKPLRIFVNSMSDLFHGQVPDEYVARVFSVMAATPQHTYQVLTKRPGRMRSLLSTPAFADAVRYGDPQQKPGIDAIGGGYPWPLPNVWLGVSAEDQRWADVRVPQLLKTPAAVRWISAEPLLGPIELGRWFQPAAALCGPRTATAGDAAAVRSFARWLGGAGLDWIVAGGESGPGARPMDQDWVRGLRDQCQRAGVAFLFKQWGGRTAKAGGRTLDGRTWDEYPPPRSEAPPAASSPEGPSSE